MSLDEQFAKIFSKFSKSINDRLKKIEYKDETHDAYVSSINQSNGRITITSSNSKLMIKDSRTFSIGERVRVTYPCGDKVKAFITKRYD